ncbi:SPOR domain-containing protein [Carboxylicivirga mesophila]|uniref:SPOR domain-containing protein n=1 Tax=Carboxylicivirga mesophila TaxID=1166478 RepID=A0ABS5K5J3_9BACT|nr:SPOR domain-containing protein [Carboxylicivirga mesophila]MBS2209813.1 SPOR domain-containing protein [Carboxylicivirga mesophila]
MTTVSQQISNLLFTHECVIVPGLGAFVSSPVSAARDMDKNLFLPPSKEIGFNRSLSHNDGLLISTLAQQNGISYGKAKVLVEEFVAAVEAKVNTGGKALIEKVGTLQKDALGYLLFVADESEAYLTDAYGLSSFHFTPVVTPQKPMVENRQVRRLLQPVSLKQIAASVAVLVGLFAISQSVENPQLKKSMNAASTISFVMPETPTEANYEVQPAELKEAELAAEEATPVEKNSYYLIAGSFKTENQAQRFLNIVHEMGEQQAFVLPSPNNRYRVAIEGYADKADAIADMGVYRQKEDFKTVWVLTQH